MTSAPLKETLQEKETAAAGNHAAGLPRLLPLVPGVPEDLRAHLARYGRPPTGNPGLIRAVEQSGLTGRGGAAFPVHRKLAIVAQARGRKVIVANGAESEPASRKDNLLLRAAPNLVLDGLQLAAEAIGAGEAHLYLHPGGSQEIARALAQRAAAGLDRVAVTVTEAPPRFLAGQESALVSRLGGGPAVPAFTPPRVSERGLGGAPTLVQNVETLAHLALIARYGPRWFRALGTSNEPGSMLVTVHTASNTQVVEAELGVPLRSLIPAAENAQAVLIGGFHGAWLPNDQHNHAGQPNAEQARRRGRRRRDRRAARRPLRPGRGGPRGPLPSRRVGRPVRPLPQRPAPDRRGHGRASRVRAPPPGPQRPGALGRPGHRARRLQPPGRHRPVRPQHAHRVRARDRPARPGPLLGEQPANPSSRCPTTCR